MVEKYHGFFGDHHMTYYRLSQDVKQTVPGQRQGIYELSEFTLKDNTFIMRDNH